MKLYSLFAFEQILIQDLITKAPKVEYWKDQIEISIKFEEKWIIDFDEEARDITLNRSSLKQCSLAASTGERNMSKGNGRLSVSVVNCP